MPRLVETKHIKHRLLRVGNGALFCSLKYISSAFRHCAGGSFFLPSARLVRRLFSFHFPVAGWLRELCNKNPKRSQIWPKEIRIPAAAKVSIREVVDILGFALAMAKLDVWDARDVGQWFLEIGFRSFAQDLATREGQRGRCPSRARENLRSQVCRGSSC